MAGVQFSPSLALSMSDYMTNILSTCAAFLRVPQTLHKALSEEVIARKRMVISSIRRKLNWMCSPSAHPCAAFLTNEGQRSHRQHAVKSRRSIARVQEKQDNFIIRFSLK